MFGLGCEIGVVATPAMKQYDWRRIAVLYDELAATDPSPIAALARAIAVGRAHGAAAGLAALPTLKGYPYSEAARGVFLSELGRYEEARGHLEKALELARTEPERRLMERRLGM